MTDEQIKELAKKHWDWLSPLLDFPMSKERAEYLYITSAIHFAKHEREEYDIDLMEIASATNDLLNAIGITEDMLSKDTIDRWNYIKEALKKKEGNNERGK